MSHIFNVITFNVYNAVNLDLLYSIAILLGMFVIVSRNRILIRKNTVVMFQSSLTTVVVKTGFISMTVSYSDILLYYDDILCFYDSAIYSISHLGNYNFKTMSPYALELYNRYLGMTGTNIIELKNLIISHGPTMNYTFFSYMNYPFFSSMNFTSHLSHLHSNIHITSSLYNMLMSVIVPTGLVVAVNIHSIIAFCIRVTAIFADFFSSIFRKCVNGYDAVKGAVRENFINYLNYSKDNSSINNKGFNSGTGGDSNDGKKGGGDKNNKKHNIPYIYTEQDLIRILLLIAYVYNRILDVRQGMRQQIRMDDNQIAFYGHPGTHNHPNLRVTLSQIIRYAIANPQEIIHDLNTTLSSILTPYSLERSTLSISLRVLFSGIFKGTRLNDAFVGNTTIRNFMAHFNINPNHLSPLDIHNIISFAMEWLLRN